MVQSLPPSYDQKEDHERTVNTAKRQVTKMLTEIPQRHTTIQTLRSCKLFFTNQKEVLKITGSYWIPRLTCKYSPRRLRLICVVILIHIILFIIASDTNFTDI